MDKNLINKVIIVTGGADGIGYQIVDYFLTEGAKTIIILDFYQSKGEESTEKLTSKHGIGKVVFVKCDVTKDLEEVSKKIFTKYKHIDVLVNNAGTVNESCGRKTLEVNSIAVIEWSMKFWEHMRKDKGGQGGTIINIGSMYSYAVDPYIVFYTTSKFAIMGFTRSLGHMDNFKKFGVRLVVICPGYTRTGLPNGKVFCWDEHTEDISNFLSKQVWQDPQEVGKAAVEVFKVAESGSAWKIIGGILNEVPLVAEGDQLR